MTRFRTLTFAAAGLCAALLAGAALHAQGPGPGGRGPGRMGGPMRPGGPGGPGGLPLRQLDLTDAQQEQIRTLVRQRQEQGRAAADRLRTAAEAHAKAMNTIPPDEARIRATAQALAEVQADLAVQQARVQGEIYELLTPEQQTKAKQILSQREARMQERMQERRQRRADRQGQRQGR